MEHAEMLHLRMAGLTYGAIAARAGLSRQRIQQLLAPPPAIRQLIVDRSKGRCTGCNLDVGESGSVHHQGTQDGDRYNDVANLTLLCNRCHLAAHADLPMGERVRTRVCLRCGYTWRPLTGRRPIRCANRACGTPYWATPRKEPHTSPR